MYPEDETFNLQLTGLAPGSRYRVHFASSSKDMTLTGAELAKGIVLNLGAPPTAELVIYQAV